MDPVQDHAAAQESAPLTDPGIPSPQVTEAAETGEIEVVCTQSIQSRELGVIAEPGERRIIPQGRLDAFLSTDAFQVLGPVTRPPAPSPTPAKPARRTKTE